MTASISDVFKYHLTKSYNDPGYFHSVVLGRPNFWAKQLEICRLVVNHKTTAIVSGNAVGKTFCTASLILWYLFTRPDSIVISTAPTANQLREVLWSQIRHAYFNSRFPLGGRIVGSPLDKLEIDDRWFAIGISTTKTEKMSGFHCRNLFVIADEASGVESEIFSAVASLSYDKLLLIGNPLRNDGFFADTCQRAQKLENNIGYLHVSSLESPHIHQERSSCGLADANFLREMEVIYGTNSSWWSAHILGKFNDSNDDVLIPNSWFHRLAEKHVPAGMKRISCDYSEGTGNDFSVVMCRDDNGIYEMKKSRTWSPATLANVIKDMANRYDVLPSKIAWDATASGSDFSARLLAAGLVGCRPYKGAMGGPATSVGNNLRANSGWAMRRRLDPTRKVGFGSGKAMVEQPPFFIPPAILAELKPELIAITYALLPNGKITLNDKQQMHKILQHSPDLADCFLISWAYS
jgi:hypothetical protein